MVTMLNYSIQIIHMYAIQTLSANDKKIITVYCCKFVSLFSRTQKVNDPCGQQEQCSTFDIDCIDTVIKACIIESYISVYH